MIEPALERAGVLIRLRRSLLRLFFIILATPRIIQLTDRPGN